MSGESAAAFSLGEIQTDGETSGQGEQEKFVSLISTRARLVDGAPRGTTEVFTTDDRRFQVGEVVLFTDLEGNVEAHRVKGYGSLIIDSPLTRDYPAGSEVRTMMGPERVYQNGPKQYVGFDQGRQWIASLNVPEVSQSHIGRAPSPPKGI
eukprot:2976475-Amphidinium_carterae.1